MGGKVNTSKTSTEQQRQSSQKKIITVKKPNKYQSTAYKAYSESRTSSLSDSTYSTKASQEQDDHASPFNTLASPPKTEKPQESGVASPTKVEHNSIVVEQPAMVADGPPVFGKDEQKDDNRRWLQRFYEWVNKGQDPDFHPGKHPERCHPWNIDEDAFVTNTTGQQPRRFNEDDLPEDYDQEDDDSDE